MGQDKADKGQGMEIRKVSDGGKYANNGDFVLEKTIFNNIFEKDIRRVFIYKKAERIAKAIHLILPAFVESVSLKNRIDAVAMGLVDAALAPPASARVALSRELLALSSVLSVAHGCGILSSMNTELISREARLLLQEVAGYEEPRLLLEEAPTLADIAKQANKKEAALPAVVASSAKRPVRAPGVKDTDRTNGPIKDRRDAILSVIKNKTTASIKDISTLVRGVSEKTIQRELAALVSLGVLRKQGERRWSTYSLA
ncbi:DeoR family transcriptional regulator [Candidatus Kaiserbacteria bacterium]|nr:DeoR family transcriptional regulator [Candidatus Kaiserbacteria bacterium]